MTTSPGNWSSELPGENTHSAMQNALDDPLRLDALARSGLLDTPPEAAFDRLTQLARRMLHTPIALVSLLDRDRQFFKSVVGTVGGMEPPRETPLDFAFCKHSLASQQPLIIGDTRKHPMVNQNPAVTQLGIVAYAGVPLTTSEGHALGSFCALDIVPRDWTPDEIAILQDLAAACLTEVELRLAARKLRDSLVDLQNSQAQRDSLMYMIVHDLRTPLSSYLVGLEVLDTLGELNDTQREVLDIAFSGGRSLQRMIDDLLDIARIEAVAKGEAVLRLAPVSVAEVVENARTQVVQLATRTGLELNAKVAPRIAPMQAEGALIERVLVNLLGNAIKFTPAPGTVCINVEAGADAVRFEVSDSGPGIGPEEWARIFELFGQSAALQAGHKKSSGLGLAFCKMAVEAHGGTIGIQSEVGSGTTFFFTVPTNG